MRIPAGRIDGALATTVIAIGCVLYGGGVVAQTPPEPAPAPPSAASAPLPAPAGAPSGADASRKTTAAETGTAPNTPAATLDYLYNRKPQDGSAAKQAAEVSRRMDDRTKAADALGLGNQQDAVAQERFEKYLGTAEISSADLKGYATIMGQVLALLREDKTFDAWKLLRQASAYTAIDAGMSNELANRIEAVWNTGRASQVTDSNNQQLKQQIKESNRNADLMSRTIREEEIRMKRKENEGRTVVNSQKANNGGAPMANADGNTGAGGAGNAANASVSGLEGKLQLTDEYLQTLEARAKIKLNELKFEKLLDASKADFSKYIGTLLSSHRQLHVIVAANFYLKIFNVDQYPVTMANQVNTALEAQRSVTSAVEVFRYKLQRNEIAAATTRLQEAFATSEFHPAILSLERTEKERVAKFTANLGKMQNMIEARDFANLETILNETKGLATDFDSTKPLALVNAVKLESKLRLGKAKLAAQQGDLKAAMEEFQAAAETWPGNPDLQDKAMTFFDTQDVKSQSLVDFDRMFAEGNFRGIFDKQLAFAPAMKDDTKRQEQLKTALEKVKNAEMASEKASAMMMGGDPYGAWETVELAAVDLPDDKKLNKLRADLSGRSAEFVSAVNKARDAEARSDFGFGLTWYVIAQRQYPASHIANEGIERLSKQVLGSSKTSSL